MKEILRGQEGIAGILDHFRRAQVGDHNGRAQGQVQLGHLVGGILIQWSRSRCGAGS